MGYMARLRKEMGGERGDEEARGGWGEGRGGSNKFGFIEKGNNNCGTKKAQK